MDTLTSVIWLAVATLLAFALGYLTSALRRAGGAQDAHLRAERLGAQLEVLQHSVAQREAQIAADRQVATNEFAALASQALTQSSEQFLTLAEQRLRGTQIAGQADMERREASVRAMVDPLTASLEALRTQVTAAEQARLVGTSTITEQVRAMRESSELLRRETAQLVTALRSSQVRGRWGEMQLRRVVEAAGMMNRVDFVEQAHLVTDDGALRPDLVVRLAGGKNIVVDAKTPFTSYLEANETDSDEIRTQRLAAHARAVRRHVDDLAAKQYWARLEPSPEFIVMFIPAEPFLQAALEADVALVEYAFERNVVIATPMTLMALLRTVAYAWRQETLATNAQEVLTLGKDLHARLATLSGHLSRLGRSIDGAATAYNQAVGSLESRVLVSARRFRDLGVVDADLAGPAPVDPRLSALGAPELVEAAALEENEVPSTPITFADREEAPHSEPIDDGLRSLG